MFASRRRGFLRLVVGFLREGEFGRKSGAAGAVCLMSVVFVGGAWGSFCSGRKGCLAVSLACLLW